MADAWTPEFWAAVQDAHRQAEQDREKTYVAVHSDPVAHAIMSLMLRVQDTCTSRDLEVRANALLDGTGAVLRLIEMAKEGRLGR